MSSQQAEWAAQLRLYEPAEAVQNGLWRSPVGGHEYRLPPSVRTVYGHTCAGQPIVEPVRLGDTYTTAIDRRGYRRRRGVQEVVARYHDKSAVLAILRDGEWRGYRRAPDMGRNDDWHPDPGALKEAWAAAGVADAVDGQAERWANVTHSQMLRAWVTHALAGHGGAGLYMHGCTGSGKTTAAKALAAEFVANGQTVLHLDVPDWARDLRASYSDMGKALEVTARNVDAQRVPLLILDDLTAVPRKDDLWLTLHTLVDRRLDAGLPTVVCDNEPHGNWERVGIDKRLSSRLHSLKPLNFGTRDWRKEPLKQ